MLDLRDAYVLPAGPDGAPACELRAFTHGLMPRTVPAMMQAFCDDWAERGVDAWNGVPDRWDVGHATSWWALPEDIGDRWIAPILGAPAGTCILQPNVHWSVSALLSCDGPFGGADGGRRDEIVLSAAEFPSVRHAAQHWAALRGARVVEVAPTADGWADTDALAEAVTDRTAWVFVSHVGFTTGEVVPDAALRHVAEAARRHGARFCIDGYHATASVPFSVEELGCDAYVGGLLKEASGSTGNAYLYVGADLRPRLAGWFADAAPFAFADAPAWHPVARRRFLAGTTNVASMYHAVEGLRVLLGAGIAAVRADGLAKTARAIGRADGLAGLGLRVRSPRDRRRGTMLVLEVDHADRLSAWLKTRGVYTDSRRGEVLRLAPFVWNPPEDIDRCFDAVEEALRSGAHLAYDAPAEGGPVT